MTLPTDSVPTTRLLSLPEELILMLLNEENGYFHQVPGWNLNCAVVGAVLAELSLLSRIDTDIESLFLIDRAETGDPALDPILKEIADEPVQRNAQYWIERLASHAEAIIDLSLDRLVDLKILEQQDGNFWMLSPTAWQSKPFDDSREGSTDQFVKTRISKVIFNNEIPDPRDVIIICLINTCDVFRFMFQLDDETEERIQFICKMDLIGRSIAAAVTHNLAGPLLHHTALTKPLPTVPLHQFLLNRHLREGNLPALFADLANRYGPVFELRPPFSQRVIFLAGPRMNRWVHRHGRMYLRAKDYFESFENVLGAARSIHSLDGADHFRLRKALQPALLSRESGEAAGRGLSQYADSYGEVGGRRHYLRGNDALVIHELASVTAPSQQRIAGLDRGHSQVQATNAQHSRRGPPAQVPATHPGDAAPGEDRPPAGGTHPEQSYTRAAGWKSPGPGG